MSQRILNLLFSSICAIVALRQEKLVHKYQPTAPYAIGYGGCDCKFMILKYQVDRIKLIYYYSVLSLQIGQNFLQ